MNDCVAACKCPGQWQYMVSCCLLLFHQQKGPPAIYLSGLKASNAFDRKSELAHYAAI